jgi:hypothetical protein
MRAYYLLGKSALPDNLQSEIDDAILQLKSVRNKNEALKKAYELITRRYYGGRINTLLKISALFSSSAQDLWNRTGFMHCTNQNYLLALLLIKSGHFKEEEINRKWTLLWGFSPHQYLRVKQGAGWTDVDAWSATYGIEFGDHAHGFHTASKLK